MSDEIKMTYDGAKQRAVLTFPNGRELTLTGVSQEKAEAFRDKHAAEFHRRDCVLSTVDGVMTREDANGG